VNARTDRYPSDNHAVAWVTTRAKARFCSSTARAAQVATLEEIIKRQGLEVTVRRPETAPAPTGYKIVIFNNAERDRFASGYLASIERHTAEGNGFIMLGADASLPRRVYRQTPSKIFYRWSQKSRQSDKRKTARLS